MLPENLSGKTRFVPILAHPVDHVRAPRTYNPAFRAAGLDWVMTALGVHPDDLAATLSVLARISNLQGINLTIPHKAAAHAACHWLGPEARRTGAVNSMRLAPDGSWIGESSDGVGFLGAARAHGVFDAARPVAIAGSGGAGRAIAFSLASAGAVAIDVSDALPERAESLAEALRAAFPALQVGTTLARLGEAGLAINASPAGLHDTDPPPFDAAALAPDAALFDIIAARDTELMAAARARGLRVVGGRAMVEGQLVYQIAFWRGDPSISLERAP